MGSGIGQSCCQNGLGSLLGTAPGITLLLTSVDPGVPGHPGSRFLQPGPPREALTLTQTQ